MKKIAKILGITILAGGMAAALFIVIALNTTHAQVQDTNNADLSAVEASNNVPGTFAPSDVETVGTDNNQIGVYVTNTGVAPWYDDQQVFTYDTGSCAGGGGYYNTNEGCPTDNQSNVGASCFHNYDNYSSIIQLHSDSANPDQFPVGNDPADYYQTSTQVCTLVSASVPAPTDHDYCSPPANTPDDSNSDYQGYTVNGVLSCDNYVPPYGDYCTPFGNEVRTPAGDGAGYLYTGPTTGEYLPDNYYCVDNYYGAQGGVPAKYIWSPMFGKTEVDPGDTILFPLGFVQAPNPAGTYTDNFHMSSGIDAAVQQYGSNGDDLNDFGSTIPVTITVVGVVPSSTISGVTVTATPTTIDTTQTTTCTAVVSGTGSYSPAVNWSATNGNITSNGVLTPSGAGTSTCTATSVQDPNKFGSATVTVSAVPTTITVESENAVTAESVNGSWQFPVNGLSSTCVPSATYSNQPFGIYTIANIQSCDQLYSLNSFRQVPIAMHSSKTLNEKLVSFAQDMIGSIANAATLSTTTPSSQTLSPSLLSANFIILWDPNAAMAIDPSSISPTGTVGGIPATTSIAITNTGAPGSTLTWTASVNATSSSWLSISPNADSSGLINGNSGNASENVSVSADPGSLASGTYQGTITFDGFTKDQNGHLNLISTSSLAVTFIVNSPSNGNGNGGSGGGSGGGSCGSGPCPAPSCIFSATPNTIVVPQKASLQYSCSNVTSCSITGGNISSPINLSSNASGTVSGSTSVSPTGNSVYTISCTGPGGTTSATAPVNVGNSTLCESNPGGVNCPGH